LGQHFDEPLQYVYPELQPVTPARGFVQLMQAMVNSPITGKATNARTYNLSADFDFIITTASCS
jgi:hypothetical protein